MEADRIASVATRLGSRAFLPLRQLAGPFHRRQPSLTQHQHENEEALPPLPAPWNDDDRWYRGAFPPREHNDVQPLVHGDSYFHDLHTSLLAAQKRVTIVGWSLTPLIPLLRHGKEQESALAEVLREVSNRAEVFVLIWAGAPALFEPNVYLQREAQRVLQRIAPKVRYVLDSRATFSHDHHQKAVTIDGRIAYVGGMDLSTLQGDRWDTAEHQLRFGPGWHDVQVRLRGGVVQDVEQNFCQRWNDVTGESLQPLASTGEDGAWATRAQVVRTVPAGFYRFAPNGEFGIHHALIAAIRRAKRFVYLENQYIWAPEIVQALVEALRRSADNSLRVVLVLPAHAYSGRYDNDRHVRLLRDAAGPSGHFEAYALYSGGAAWGSTGYAYAPIYVHAKVAIVDDEWFMVGSANLNKRGLATDTEMSVQAVDPNIARELRVQLWAEHLGLEPEALQSSDPIDDIDRTWKQAAAAVEGCVSSRSMPCPGHAHRYVTAGTPQDRILDLVQDVALEH